MNNFIQWVTAHYVEIGAALLALIGLLEIIVNLTPTEKDNSILLKIKSWIAFIFPNNAKGGGTHEVETMVKTKRQKRIEKRKSN